MEEMLEMMNETLEDTEITETEELQGMYRDAYETAVRDGATDMAEYYKNKLGIEDNEISFGGDTSESGWLHKADKEYAKNGESSYYEYCLEQAAKKHRESERG